MSTNAIDAVNLSIMWDRLVGITDEIISPLVRSSLPTRLGAKVLSNVVEGFFNPAAAHGVYGPEVPLESPVWLWSHLFVFRNRHFVVSWR